MQHNYLFATALAPITPFAQAINEGDKAPSCPSAATPSQITFVPDAYQGKVVLVDFWATCCPPCKKSMPFLNQLRNDKLNQGFEIIAINVDEDSEEAKQYLTSNPVDYPMFFDPKGQCPGVFEVKAMPSSYLINKAGNVQEVYLGFRDQDQATIKDQLAE